MAEPVKVRHPVSGKLKIISPRALERYRERGFVLEGEVLEEAETELEEAETELEELEPVDPDPGEPTSVRPRRRSKTNQSADDGADKEQTE